MIRPQAILDIETYPNYFLIALMRCEDDYIVKFERTHLSRIDTELLAKIIRKYELITFNGKSYDIPLLRLALTGAANSELKHASDSLINNDKLQDFEKRYNLPPMEINFIDLIDVAPLKASLKIYAGRLHCHRMQDLPYSDTRILSESEMKIVSDYCENDLRNTKLLLNELSQQIDLRRKMSNKYKVDLRSKSDAQIAEAVIKSELFRKTRKRIAKPESKSYKFKYEFPGFIQFKTSKFDKIINLLRSEEFHASHSGIITMPKKRIDPDNTLGDLQLMIGNSIYQLGMGGLHSSEKNISYISDEYTIIADMDVTSYYPRIILNCKLFPEQLGPEFLDIYNEIVEDRIAGKRAGNKVIADSLRIVINGSFGKLGSAYSVLYAPQLMIQVTITGQLSLLMLIEDLELAGIPVVSGNTDGIVVKCPRRLEDKMKEIVTNWENKTGFNMERSDYKAIYFRDVNNYIAIKQKGEVKTKGCFSIGGLSKNPQNEICNEALIAYLKNGTPFMESLVRCKDVTKFITVRTVKGGAVYGKDYLGKAIRWIYTTNTYGNIRYKTSNNKVPRTEGAFPIMELPEKFPRNINYKWYEDECKELLCDLGIGRPKQGSLF